MKVERLVGPIRTYAWGSHHFIANLQGRRAPTAEPEAELWLGAHPGAPSEVEDVGQRTLLNDFIDEDRERALGARVTARFDGELPFLLKVLAAAQPLSLQAHPSRSQAEDGFAREQAAGIPISAAERNYKDRSPKPELIVALTPFFALSGFRHPATTAQLLRALEVPELEPTIAHLAEPEPSRALSDAFSSLMTLSPSERSALALKTLEGAKRQAEIAGPFQKEFAWAVRLGALYPGDIGIVGALLLNLVELAPFQGIFLPAGNLHAYLEGSGIEIMAASDNVLRGGLTPKAVNVPELLRVLDFSELAPKPLSPRVLASGERVYETPSEEFRLSYVPVEGTVALTARESPEIVLVTAGELNLESSTGSLALLSGDAAFIPASERGYVLRGTGTAFRATVGETTS
ncbi:MAG TPA: mannose-6-phosphate isomerase, class I [Polyangiaceae bacterium]|nr:mannose-6-phosphate isomerase, class I [Polyangiaceae bacterium]